MLNNLHQHEIYLWKRCGETDWRNPEKGWREKSADPP